MDEKTLRKMISDRAAAEKKRPDLVEQAYLTECLLRRLAASDMVDGLLLRGGKLWLVQNHDHGWVRPTLDTDMVSTRSFLSHSDANLKARFEAILTRDLGDGVVITVAKVGPLSETPGVRISVEGTMGGAPVRGELDLANGSVPTVGPRQINYPLMFDGAPGFQILAHPWEVSFAEKLVLLWQSAGQTLHVKHLADIVRMVREIDLDPTLVREALAWAVERRNALPLPEWEEMALDEKSMEKAYASYQQRITGTKTKPADFTSAMEALRGFLEGYDLIPRTGPALRR